MSDAELESLIHRTFDGLDDRLDVLVAEIDRVPGGRSVTPAMLDELQDIGCKAFRVWRRAKSIGWKLAGNKGEDWS